MNFFLNKEPYWLKAEDIHNVEKLKNAKFMGFWATKRPDGSWNESPVDVFYVENPDTSKGHTNYFGLFFRDGKLYITDGSSAFSEPITGILAPDGEVIVSRYRHHMVTKNAAMIDGGRDYIRSSGDDPFVNVTVDGSEFKFEVKHE
jgi:hypothetical protein